MDPARTPADSRIKVCSVVEHGKNGPGRRVDLSGVHQWQHGKSRQLDKSEKSMKIGATRRACHLTSAVLRLEGTWP